MRLNTFEVQLSAKERAHEDKTSWVRILKTEISDSVAQTTHNKTNQEISITVV